MGIDGAIGIAGMIGNFTKAAFKVGGLRCKIPMTDVTVEFFGMQFLQHSPNEAASIATAAMIWMGLQGFQQQAVLIPLQPKGAQILPLFLPDTIQIARLGEEAGLQIGVKILLGSEDLLIFR